MLQIYEINILIIFFNSRYSLSVWFHMDSFSLKPTVQKLVLFKVSFI